jgi:ribonuclease-3
MNRLEDLCQQFLFFLEEKYQVNSKISLEVLAQVLMHPSYAHEKSLMTSYEKLEFLGDSIANAIITTSLYQIFKEESEGTLSRIRSALISNESLSHLAKIISLEKYLCTTGLSLEEFTNSHAKTLGRAFEALMGALYLELGFAECKTFLERVIKEWENTHQMSWFDKDRLLAVDVKSLLQEKLHAYGLHNPQYVMVEHHKKNAKDEFVMALTLDQKEIARAKAHSKKEAEKLVAKKILENWSLVKEINR